MAGERIQRKKVSEEAFERLQNMIAQGAWQPGDKLPSENELQALFQVSRVSIREALKRLESCGIIETRQGKGSFLRKFEDADLFDSRALVLHMTRADECTIRDMMEFRRIVELESVYLATQRMTEEDLQELRKNYQNMLDARKDIRRFSDYDFAFHAAIARMTGNTILIRCYSVILQCLKEYFDQVVERIGVDKGSFYHGEILAAMEKRDAGLARDRMREHLAVTASGFFAITEQEREQAGPYGPDSSAGLSAAEAAQS